MARSYQDLLAKAREQVPEVQVADLAARRAAGGATELEVLRAQVDVENQRAELFRAESASESHADCTSSRTWFSSAAICSVMVSRSAVACATFPFVRHPSNSGTFKVTKALQCA